LVGLSGNSWIACSRVILAARDWTSIAVIKVEVRCGNSTKLDGRIADRFASKGGSSTVRHRVVAEESVVSIGASGAVGSGEHVGIIEGVWECGSNAGISGSSSLSKWNQHELTVQLIAETKSVDQLASGIGINGNWRGAHQIDAGTGKPSIGSKLHCAKFVGSSADKVGNRHGEIVNSNRWSISKSDGSGGETLSSCNIENGGEISSSVRCNYLPSNGYNASNLPISSGHR